MKPSTISALLTIVIVLYSCAAKDQDSSPDLPVSPEQRLYFPPVNSTVWDTQSPDELGWSTAALDPLLEFLEITDTRAFIILFKGKIVVEHYFNGADSNTNHPWFSAGKTLTAFVTGLAQEDGFLNLTDTSSDYLGTGWTQMPETLEADIKIVHHLTMTTGLDFNEDLFCTSSICLDYLYPAGSFWYYHNAPYTITQSIISEAVNQPFQAYFNNKLKDRIGMQGLWIPSGFNNFYFSNARSMARFGLLCLNKGLWNEEVIMGELAFFNAMISTSQNQNKAYGYLWWLNGKESYRLPGSEVALEGALIPNAPNDLIAGLGANDQKLYVIPSEDLVIVRLGGDGGSANLGPSGYDIELWSYLNNLINN